MVRKSTSISNPLYIKEIDCLNGKIGITFCPGKCGPSVSGKTMYERDIDSDLEKIKDWDADIVLTLLEKNEMEFLKVSSLPEKVRNLQIKWIHLPIKDSTPPDNETTLIWDKLRHELAKELELGKKVVIHCRGGLGRAGTIATSLVKTCNPKLNIKEAVSIVRKARPLAIETKEQMDWLYRFHGIANKPKF